MITAIIDYPSKDYNRSGQRRSPPYIYKGGGDPDPKLTHIDPVLTQKLTQKLTQNYDKK